MFNQHLFPSFHSLKDFFEDYHPVMITDDERMARMAMWQQAQEDAKDHEKKKKEREQQEAQLQAQKSTKSIFHEQAREVLERKPEIQKLSYLPKRLSRLAGIEKFFEATDATIITPSTYKISKRDRNKFFYLIPRNVSVIYGPYHYLGILDYRTERLHGLLTALKFAGANTILRPSNHVNHVSVWYLEREIFKCRITELHHGGDGELDKRAFQAADTFRRMTKQVLLNVRHKYKFDKHKGNLFRTCPCHADYPGSPFFSDDDLLREEFLGEGEYTSNTGLFAQEYEGEGDYPQQKLRPVTGERKLMRKKMYSPLKTGDEPEPFEMDTSQEEEEFLELAGETELQLEPDNFVDSTPKTLKPWEKPSVIESKLDTGVIKQGDPTGGAFAKYYIPDPDKL